jgi:hypothetical protein
MTTYQLKIRKLLASPETAQILKMVVPFPELLTYYSRYGNGRIASEDSAERAAKRDYKRLTHYLKVRK